jgi:cytochrome P450 family 12
MAVRPFSHGPRMCIGKRFAELEIQIGICKLLQIFRIEWAADYDGIEQRLKTLNVPDKKLKLRFVDLKDEVRLGKIRID